MALSEIRFEITKVGEELKGSLRLRDGSDAAAVVLKHYDYVQWVCLHDSQIFHASIGFKGACPFLRQSDTYILWDEISTGMPALAECVANTAPAKGEYPYTYCLTVLKGGNHLTDEVTVEGEGVLKISATP